MTENDIEQLSNYMDHTTGVHRQNYRLPDDIFQTAKISKLLILIENGQADAFKGKCLDEININMDEELEGEGLRREDILDFAESENTLQESDMVADLSTTTAQDPETPHKDNAASTYEPLMDIPETSLRSTKKKKNYYSNH
ncbi:unnamed protein product [Euphydryas editha]|uniref:Uncharacterized protein n=1 Tax=Euphydryas editha TaxID=104508 RepID=A0AAU9URU0_EUPED|nr:unnamed protein product [Euphydryas editha]